jgi:hypothetical protein
MMTDQEKIAELESQVVFLKDKLVQSAQRIMSLQNEIGRLRRYNYDYLPYPDEYEQYGG